LAGEAGVTGSGFAGRGAGFKGGTVATAAGAKGVTAVGACVCGGAGGELRVSLLNEQQSENNKENFYDVH